MKTSKDVCKAVAWLGDDADRHPRRLLHLSATLDPKYVSYFFQSSAFQDQKTMFATGTKVQASPVADTWRRSKCLCRHSAVQRKIAAILDKMEMLKAELEAELEAELNTALVSMRTTGG